MRIIRTICAPALVLAMPAFLTFQIAAMPMVSCDQDACELWAQIMPCAMERGDAVDEPIAEMGGCCQGKKVPSPEPSGCCQSDKIPPSRGGCAGGGAAPPPCAQKTDQPDTPDNPQCPENQPLCGLCPFVPVAAEAATKPRAPEVRTQILPAIHIPTILSQSVEGPWEIRNHAPPLTALVRAGPDRRVDLCSFLL